MSFQTLIDDIIQLMNQKKNIGFTILFSVTLGIIILFLFTYLVSKNLISEESSAFFILIAPFFRANFLFDFLHNSVTVGTASKIIASIYMLALLIMYSIPTHVGFKLIGAGKTVKGISVLLVVTSISMIYFLVLPVVFWVNYPLNSSEKCSQFSGMRALFIGVSKNECLFDGGNYYTNERMCHEFLENEWQSELNSGLYNDQTSTDLKRIHDIKYEDGLKNCLEKRLTGYYSDQIQ